MPGTVTGTGDTVLSKSAQPVTLQTPPVFTGTVPQKVTSTSAGRLARNVAIIRRQKECPINSQGQGYSCVSERDRSGKTIISEDIFPMWTLCVRHSYPWRYVFPIIPFSNKKYVSCSVSSNHRADRTIISDWWSVEGEAGPIRCVWVGLGEAWWWSISGYSWLRRCLDFC